MCGPGTGACRGEGIRPEGDGAGAEVVGSARFRCVGEWRPRWFRTQFALVDNQFGKWQHLRADLPLGIPIAVLWPVSPSFDARRTAMHRRQVPGRCRDRSGGLQEV